MPNEEVEIMRDMFCFLRDHNDPPANGTDEAVTFWMTAAKDMGAVAAKWQNHPLATSVLITLYGYLEDKGRQKGGAG